MFWQERFVPNMDLSKKKILMNSFFNSQFSHWPLIWMFHKQNKNNILIFKSKILISKTFFKMTICMADIN